MNLSRLCRFLFSVMFTVLAVSAWAQTGNRYALVIGNADYQRIDKLRNTVNDAQDISAALKGLGYQVDLKLNLGHLQMVDAIEAFTVKLAGNRANEGFFWYAGHAVQIRDENYLLPVDVTVDTENRVRAGSFSLNNLIDMLDGAKNKVNVLILDACRDNPLPGAGRGGGGRGLAVVREVPSDLFIMFSTAPGDKADDGAAGKRNSPFAEAFLKYIKSPEPVYQMAIDVTQETLSLTGQRQRPFQRGSIISEKYYSLNPQAAKPAAQSAQPVQTTQPTAQTATQPAQQQTPAATGNAKDHYDKGVVFYERKDYDTAILEFNETIRIDPNYRNAYLYRGNAYYNKKDYDKAFADYIQVIRIDPNYALAYLGRGNAYYVKKDYDKAIADYDQAIQIDPNYAMAYNNRGMAWEAKGDKTKADADYAKAKQLGYK
jgi:tetratricopeptide (TPR) repeat protein